MKKARVFNSWNFAPGLVILFWLILFVLTLLWIRGAFGEMPPPPPGREWGSIIQRMPSPTGDYYSDERGNRAEIIHGPGGIDYYRTEDAIGRSQSGTIYPFPGSRSEPSLSDRMRKQEPCRHYLGTSGC